MLILCIILIAAGYYDYRRAKIPNTMVLCILIEGLIRQIWIDGIAGAGTYLLTVAVVVFLLYPLFRIGGLGAGDVKLMAVCAGFFPVVKMISFLFVSLLISAVFSIIQLFRERDVRDRVYYFCSYCRTVVLSGKWSLYQPVKNDQKLRGVCMTGPVLCSVLLGLGGVY